MEKAKVYFTKNITPRAMIQMLECLQADLSGRVAVKVHSGEVGNQNFIRPAFMKDIIKHVNGVIVEGNTAYEGQRNTTEKHMKTMKLHGWCDIAQVDILDESEEISLPVRKGLHLQENFVGEHLNRYDAMLVLSHFKGHPMGGFGGALKNISIGIASSHGKAHIHGAGEPEHMWDADHDAFLESMADASSSILDFFGKKIAFLNVMCNMSVDCDCCAKAEDPAIADIGILSSMDPVALDQACIDLVYASKDSGRDHLIERIESRNGIHTIEAAARLGLGQRTYELINVDK